MFVKNVDQDSAQVTLPPPIVFVSLLILGFGLQYIHPLPFVRPFWRIVLSSVLLSLGAGILAWCLGAFRKNATNIEPWRSTHTLIQDGLYHHSRNPIYLSGMLLFIGMAVAGNSLWILALSLVLFSFLNFSVIPKEERYLQSKFGNEYLSYKSAVRRWI